MSVSRRTGGGRHDASSTAANSTAWLFGGLTTILGVGPAYQLLNEPFIGHVVGFYGESFAGLAALFLLVMLLALIFTLSTFITHNLMVVAGVKFKTFMARLKGRY